MAKCPNCGRKLHFTDWKPVCPGCGVNLNYYKANERLLAESEKSEIEHAKFQPKVDRAKQATIGTWVGRIRLALFIIPILSLLLPIFSITVGGAKKNINAIEIYNIFSTVDTGGILSNLSPIIIAVALVAVPAVCCIVFAIMQIAAGTKKGLKKNIILSSISICLVLASLICILSFAGSPAKDYKAIIVNEATLAMGGSSQSAVDAAVKKMQAALGDDAVSRKTLEAAFNYGTAAAADSERGYTAEQLSALKGALKDAEAVLAAEKTDIDTVRDAAAAVNSAVNVYPDLESAVKYAPAVSDNTDLAESSRNDLTAAVEDGKALLERQAKGELLVELVDDDGTGDKTEEEIKEETDALLLNAANRISGAANSLTDISAAKRVFVEFSDADLSADIKANAGIGIFVMLLLLLVQLAYNIVIFKKGFDVKYTVCYIGGLPSDEYFSYVESGMSELELKKKMVVALTKMQDEVRAKQAAEEEKAQAERATHK